MRYLLAASLLLAPAAGFSQGTAEDYLRSEELNRKFQGLTTDVAEAPHWISGTSRAWYRKSAPGGNVFVLVDATTRKKQPAFDHDRMAAAISTDSTKYTGLTLPFTAIEFVEKETALTFAARGSNWRCPLATYVCVNTGPVQGGGRGRGGMPWVDDPQQTPEELPSDEEIARAEEARVVFSAAQQRGQTRVSPDSSMEAFIQDFNIWIRPGPSLRQMNETGTLPARRFSSDGTEKTPYVINSVLWSPDSKKFVAYKMTSGTQRRVMYVLSSPADRVQPRLDSSSLYRKPGDVVDLREPVLFDVASGTAKVIDRTLFPNPYTISRFEWYKDSRGFTFEDNERGHQAYRVIEVDATTGNTRAVIDEQSKTFIYYNATNEGLSAGKHFRADLNDGREMIWMSERDGWNHLYLYDGATGKVKNQITKGEWVVRHVSRVDSVKRQIYFAANGRNAGEDPYLLRHYRVNFDGTQLTDLTPARGNHAIEWSSDNRFYVDTYSSVDVPPVSEIRRGTDGALVMTLETPDISRLTAAGWRAPEVFVAKARDGTTDIWGVIFRPTNFDSTKKYPVIENIYAGPQGSFVPKSFSVNNGMRNLAELGFIVVQVDGMGTSNRSKAFHDVAAKNLGDAGFPDRILWHKAIAAKYPSYDVSRVGIYGTSAGGQNALGALLFHPEFYKAAFSAAGCHDNRMDKIWWNEQWMGVVGAHYDSSSNVTNAARLQGKLLLVVGEHDTNVDPSSTIQVANALIRANKMFDLLVIPNADHTSGGPYGERKRNDFFVHNLIGAEGPDRNAPVALQAGARRPGGQE